MLSCVCKRCLGQFQIVPAACRESRLLVNLVCNVYASCNKHHIMHHICHSIPHMGADVRRSKAKLPTIRRARQQLVITELWRWQTSGRTSRMA